MKLKCRACGAPIPAASINVQQMVAVCPECDNVFKFDNVFGQKRRKLKAPLQFRIVDDDPDRLDMAFHWSPRTESPISMTILVTAFCILVAVSLSMIMEGAPGGVLLIPLIGVAFLGYTLTTLLVNSTHYESDGETLRIYTEPLPYFRYGSKSISTDAIEQVSVEPAPELPAAEGKKGFYNVFVHTLDGDKLKIAAIVNYEHAYFIAQEVEAFTAALRETSSLPHDHGLIEIDDSEPLEESLPAQPREALRS